MYDMQNTSSKNVAKERLKNMLLRDRVDISTDELKQLKDDMICLAEEYFPIKRSSCDIYLTDTKKYTKESSETLLVCVLPLGRRE